MRDGSVSSAFLPLEKSSRLRDAKHASFNGILYLRFVCWTRFIQVCYGRGLLDSIFSINLSLFDAFWGSTFSAEHLVTVNEDMQSNLCTISLFVEGFELSLCNGDVLDHLCFLLNISVCLSSLSTPQTRAIFERPLKCACLLFSGASRNFFESIFLKCYCWISGIPRETRRLSETLTKNPVYVSLQASRRQRQGQGEGEKEEGTLLGNSRSHTHRHRRLLYYIHAFFFHTKRASTKRKISPCLTSGYPLNLIISL